ncbi:MAG: hypothetical protein KGZ80_03175 [Methylomonas sp.]|nr:hypothetical protein [Methylomonas sp.]PPD19600.1 MAG: hypothetical protein CTY23_11360 [Methylomonas sp.]PPD25708.1 MAG: hypothetical protein CTY22_07645 [Methylomonas sp.]PPD36919.1 MAG: hypothetical protein CTY21_07645 [Methylomonas sp.]PPD38703.1 MAG: hypothetical protein CTY17_09035 [Methylomonas sp.]
MNIKNLYRQSAFALLGLFFSSAVLAHGGATGTDTDQCKFELEKDHWIHYTAYQPKAYPAEEFCGNIPDTDSLIQLVFDYQDQRYRNMSVEFEVTKEPEGTRVFYQEPKKHKSGTVVLNLPNGVPEPGKYLIHITLLQDSGERLDAHMGFKAGGGQPTSKGSMGLYALVIFAGLYILYLSNAGFKRKVDELLGKAKEF